MPKTTAEASNDAQDFRTIGMPSTSFTARRIRAAKGLHFNFAAAKRVPLPHP
jgi:hypothetical protein